LLVQLTQNIDSPSVQNGLQVFLGVLERRVHKLIDLNQVTILTSEILKEQMQTKETNELVESIISRDLEIGETLSSLFKYIKEFKSLALVDFDKKKAQV
jgi:hypothetical protein